MAYMLTSPLLGEISEEVHDILYEEFAYDEYLKEFARTFGARRTVIPAILKIEHSLTGIHKGRDIYEYLVFFGFSKETSISVMKLFSASERFINDMVDEGYSESIATYSFNHIRRMNYFGLESISMRPSFAFEQDIKVRSIKRTHIEEPPPTEYEHWRPFQLSMLIDCSTRNDKGIIQKRKIEFRGIFTAARDSIVDWSLVGKSREDDILMAAGESAEVILKRYASIKGYDDLMSCSNVEFYGINLLESESDIYVEYDELSEYKTDNVLEVVDIDYNMIRFTDKLVYIGEWWKNKNYYITELNKQVEMAMRWG